MENSSKTMAVVVELKHLFIIAITLTIISLFVAHNTNPFHLISTLAPISTDSSNNNIYTKLNSKSIPNTSPECQKPDINKYKDINRKISEQEESKYAYIHVLELNTDLKFQVYGILAFQGGLQRTKSKQDHILMIPQIGDGLRDDLYTINSKETINDILTIFKELSSKIDKFKVITFDSTEIDKAFISNPSHSDFRDTFHAAYAFKNIPELSQYEKLLLVQYNMVILSNSVDIIFNYPTPSAPPERWSGLESNIACFLYDIKDNKIYETILEHLSKDIYVWYNDEDNKNKEINENSMKWEQDSWNTEKGTFQSLLNAIYWNRDYMINEIGVNSDDDIGINQIHQKFAVNTNKLSNRRTKYFVEHRKNMLYMIEFVDDYPPTKKARDRCKVRSNKMMDDNYKLDWFEVIMNTYFVQFWLDFSIISTNYDGVINKFHLDYDQELKASRNYHQKYGYPYPYIPQ